MNYHKSTWIIIQNKNKEILFLKRKSNWLWTLPWWKIEDWESDLDCAYRELEEETWITGIPLQIYSYNTSFTNNKHWLEAIYIWYIEDDTIIRNNEINIFEKIQFFHLENIPDLEAIEQYDHIIIEQLKGNIDRKLDYQ